LTKDIAFRELVLCGYCDKHAIRVEGYEWFKFSSPEYAEVSLKKIFDLISRDDFGRPQHRSSYYPKMETNKRFTAAMVLIEKGSPAVEAAKKVGLPPLAVLNRKQYRSWKEQQEVSTLNIEVIEPQQ
jgi:hypothetical protein